MPTLSLERRAERRAKRRNTALLKKYPLLTEEIQHGSLQHWLTTVEQARADLQRIEVRVDAMVDRLRRFHDQMSQEASQLRKIVSRYVTTEQLASFDEQRKKYPPDGTYAHSFWFTTLRDVAVREAQLRCEHQPHNQVWMDTHERCPRCWLPIQREQPAQPQQLAFFTIKKRHS